MTAPGGAATVDLQVHSTSSDGAIATAEIPAHAAAAKLSAFALTDHDSIDGVLRARVAAEPLGIRVIAGVELSAMAGTREVHILGLHIAALDVLNEKLIAFRAQRSDRAADIVTKLRALGLPVTLDEVTRQAAGGAMGRPHVARALMASGAVRDFREAFDRYLGAGRPAYVPKPRLSVRDATTILHDVGALAVWAHPGPEGRREVIEGFIAEGLDGVEVLHPGHSPEDVARLRALCDHLQIVPSGGSDWHGDLSGSRTLGVMHVPMEMLERQDALVNARANAGRA